MKTHTLHHSSFANAIYNAIVLTRNPPAKIQPTAFAGTSRETSTTPPEPSVRSFPCCKGTSQRIRTRHPVFAKLKLGLAYA